MPRPTPAPLRADAARNRAALIDAAQRVFAAAEAEPSMREIAREAGVGVGTLYRHFPTREAVVLAVYQDQLAKLGDGGLALLAQQPPAAALRSWMDLFGEWIATKRGMTDTLLAMLASGEIAQTGREELLGVITTMLDAGAAAGELRPDISAEDIAAALLGIFTVAGAPGQHEQAGRLLDLLMSGLRPR